MLTLLCCTSVQAEDKEPAATVAISGYGFFGNRALRSLVTVLERPGERPATFEASFIEDAVLILFSRLNRDGHLYPTIVAKVQTDTGEELSFTWTAPVGEPLPRTLAARRIEFEIQRGVRFYFEEIRFAGVNALSLREAAHFFVETDALIKTKENRIYSPERLRVGIKNLESALERLGYESAAAFSTNLVVQTNTGAVTVDIFVTEGPLSLVRSIRKEVAAADTNLPPAVEVISTNIVFSRLWEQDFRLQLRREQYRYGHADVSVEIAQLARDLHAGTNFIDIAAKVRPGPIITIGEVKFEGEKETSEALMRRRVRVSSGDILDPIQAEQGRYRLGRLGIFDFVDLRYDKVDEDTRDVVYYVNEGKRLNFSLLAGYGSYEQLRGGFELEQYNLWGLAHHTRLRAIQSFKSTSADYIYSIPALLAGEDIDIFLNASGLVRDEPAFTRKEFGGGAGVRRHFREAATDVTARYSYQVLSATHRDVPPEFGLSEASVGSFIFDIRHDRRDNPLTPRRGYKIFANFEIASEAFFGDANFKKMELSASYHLPIGEFRWLHFGASHGFITTPNGPAEDLPVNRRFFPGGDNSIRGFQYGEAAPRDANGDLVGAETYVLGNIEFEQGLTRSISFIAFFDALGQAASINDYPFNEGLYSVGLGFRWRTIIGPIRLEYGRNINPRPEDPAGTVHLSIGFPF